ncbi:MAG TPA: hypothetical protein VKQ54_11350 [Caulobacteraceae bacterium]|nr:hypothetical protein [Caulobacteraceae bacterium]
MKFMVFTSPTEEGLKNPPSAAAYGAHVEFMRSAVDSGVIQTALHGKGRAIFVVNADTELEVDVFFRSAPLAYQMKRVVEPLEDFFEHARRIHAYLLESDVKHGAA